MNSKKIAIRKLNDTKNDTRIFRIFDRKLAIYEKKLDPRLLKSENIPYNNIPKVLKSRKCMVLVVEISYCPVGYIVVKIKKFPKWYGGTQYGYIESIYIDKEFRNAGMATALFLEIKKWLQNKEIKTIKLRVFSNNHKAIKLYKKWGFTMIINEMIL